jgi:glyoxylase-like metal-dependent hydrolase (beta-lactamase superfamily II)
LAELAEEQGTDRLPLELMMLSHIDDDHINGLLALADKIEEGKGPARIKLIWHNSLEGLLEGKLPEPGGKVATASVGGAFSAPKRAGANGGPRCSPRCRRVRNCTLLPRSRAWPGR